MEIWIL